MEKILEHLKLKKDFALSITALVIVVGTVFLVTNKGNSGAKAVTVKRADISEEVSVTGQVKASKVAEFGFEKSGTILEIRKYAGDPVVSGDIIAVLKNGDLYADILEARAGLSGAEAKLEDKKKGARDEEIEVNEAKVTKALTTLTDSLRHLYNTIADGYTRADDSVRTKIDQLFSNPRSVTPRFNHLVSDSELLRVLESGRRSVEVLLIDWNARVYNKENLADILAESELVWLDLSVVKSFLANVALAVSFLSPSSSVSQATIDGWKSDISSARTSVNTAISNLSSATEAVREANENLSVARRELSLLRAGASLEEIKLAESERDRAKAVLARNEATYSKSVLRAPFNGVVGSVRAKVGELVSANENIVSVVGKGDFEVEANLPEVDVGRVAVHNPVRVTIDAFPGEKFSGEVASIDPAETVFDGVVNFRIFIRLVSPHFELKNGLTANLSIETIRKNNALVVPEAAVLEKDEGFFVTKIQNGEEKDVPIEIGIRGRDGMVEVLGGLVEGDEVLLVGLKDFK